MICMSIHPSQFDLISKLIQGATLQHRTISENIANVNTPGYKAKDVDFSTFLANADKSHASSRDLGMVLKSGLSERLDGNNVDVDREVGAFQKNLLLHNAYTEILATKFRQMRSAITGRS